MLALAATWAVTCIGCELIMGQHNSWAGVDLPSGLLTSIRKSLDADDYGRAVHPSPGTSHERTFPSRWTPGDLLNYLTSG
jgi:hypothetical protein